MATKETNRRRDVTRELRIYRCSDEPSSTSTMEVGPKEKWVGVFSRRKPEVLRVTSLSYEESILIDDRTSGCRRHNASSGLRSGDLHYCHPSTGGSKTSFDSRPQISTAMTLAKARFTSNSYAETLAESRQTSRMIGKRIGTLTSLAKAIRARDRIRADKIAARMRGEQYVYKNTQGKPISRRFADGWLEYQFGWLPVLADIYDLVGYYNNRLHRGMQVGRSYATNGGFSVSNGSTAVERAKRIRNHGASAKAVVRTTVSNPTLRTLSEMGLTNPMSLAWDLLPYSFVVDWILPISSILKSLLYGVGLTDVDSYTVTEHGSFRYISVACCGSYVGSYKRNVIRQPALSGVLPSIFTNPRDLGLWHVITSTALLRQQFTGGRIR